MSEPFDVLIVGAGRIAGGYDEGRDEGGPRTHAGAFRRDGRFRLRACVEPDPARRAAFMAHWGVGRGFADLPAALDACERIDVVSICSPTNCHAEALEQVLAAAPRLVFCEKPLADDLGAAERLVDAYEAAGVTLAVNYLRRWDREIMRLRAEIAAGLWGAPRAVIGVYGRGLLNNGGHMVDLIHWLFGPVSVTAAGPLREDGVAGDPTVDGVLALRDGGTAHLVGADGRDFAMFELTAIMQHGVVEIRDLGFTQVERRAEDSRRFPGVKTLSVAATRAGGLDDAMTEAISALCDHLTVGAELVSTGRTALEAHRVCQALRETCS